MAIKRIDHIAIVVSDIEEAQKFYQAGLGMEVTHLEQVDEQEVIVAFMPAGNSEIELVEPINETSGVAKYLKKHGQGIHHIALEVDSIEDTLAQLKVHDIELINQEPTIGSGGKKVAFIHPRSTSGVLIELYENTPEEPALRADIVDELRSRFETERKALAAGWTAFLSGLRSSAGQGDGNGKGIILKAEGEMVDIEE